MVSAQARPVPGASQPLPPATMDAIAHRAARSARFFHRPLPAVPPLLVLPANMDDDELPVSSEAAVGNLRMPLRIDGHFKARRQPFTSRPSKRSGPEKMRNGVSGFCRRERTSVVQLIDAHFSVGYKNTKGFFHV